MRAAAAIAGNELRRRIRDRSILIIGVVAPLGLAFVLSLLLGPLDAETFDLDVGLVDHDGGEITSGLAGVLRGLGEQGIRLTEHDDRDTATAAIGDDLDAVVVVPRGVGDAIVAGRPATVEVIGGVDAPLATEITRSIVDGYLQRAKSTATAVGVVLASDPGADVTALVARAAAEPPPVTVGEVSAATRLLDPSGYYTAAMAVFFVFFTVQIGVTSLLDERRDGTMSRLLAAPIPHGAIVSGKAMASFLLGVGTMTVLAVAAQTALGADWGPTAGVALLVVAVVLAAMGIMAVIAGYARTPESAANLQSIVAITLGALGGAFFEVPADGPFAVIAMFSPHRWFLDGLASMAGGAGAAAALPAVGAILLFAVVTGTIGWMRLARSLVP